MSIASLKAYIATHFAKAEEEMKVKITEVVAYFEDEETKDAEKVSAEIADLESRGYIVTAPVQTPAPTVTEVEEPVAVEVAHEVDVQVASNEPAPAV